MRTAMLLAGTMLLLAGGARADGGEDPEAAPGGAPAAAPGGPPLKDVRLAEALQQALLVYEADGDGDGRVLLNYESGRSQLVFVTSSTEWTTEGEWREIWSVAGVGDPMLQPATLELALRATSDERPGAWCLRQLGERPALVYRVPVPAGCEPAQLRGWIRQTGRVADSMEASLGGGDEY